MTAGSCAMDFVSVVHDDFRTGIEAESRWKATVVVTAQRN
jgi:hypothetical protein